MGGWAGPTTHMSIDRQFGWMWAQACELLDRADRMQRQFVRYVGPSADAAVWEPPVDIQETPEGLQFVFALPGVNAEHIDINLEPNAFTVRAIRPARKSWLRRPRRNSRTRVKSWPIQTPQIQLRTASRRFCLATWFPSSPCA